MVVGIAQRIYISDRRDSTPLRLPNICPPNLSLLCRQYTVLQLPDCLTEQAGGEVGWANVRKTQGGAVPSITDIYSLLTPLCSVAEPDVFLDKIRSRARIDKMTLNLVFLKEENGFNLNF